MKNSRDQIILSKVEDIITSQETSLNIILRGIYSKQLAIVRNYIKENSRILYGGIAINEYLKKSGKPIYKETDFPDYDFMSPDSLKDAYTIANILYKSGTKYVRIIPALHSGTVRLQIDFKIYICDITYIPTVYYNFIEKTLIDGMYYVTPNLLRVSLYKTICGIDDTYRWKKDFKRLALINQFYKLPDPEKPNKKRSGASKLLASANIIAKALIPGSFCFCGKIANKIYTDADSSVGAPVIEIALVSGAITDTISRISGLISGLMSWDGVLDVYSGESQDFFLPTKYVLTFGTIAKEVPTNSKGPQEDIKPGIVIIIYDYFNVQISRLVVSGIPIVSHHFLTMYYYALLSLYGIKSEKHFNTVIKQYYTREEIMGAISLINVKSEEYYKKYGILGTEKKLPSGDINLFRLFNTDYIGTHIDEGSTVYKKYLKNNQYAHKRHIVKIYQPDYGVVDVKDIKFIKRVEKMSVSQKIVEETTEQPALTIYYPFDYFGTKIVSRMIKGKQSAIKSETKSAVKTPVKTPVKKIKDRE